MRITTILNQCHRFPGFVYGQASFADDGQSILIPIHPRKGSRATCAGCHRSAAGYDQSKKPRRFEFIGLWGFVVFFVYFMRRVGCGQCGVMVEEVPWVTGPGSCPGRKPPNRSTPRGTRSMIRSSIWWSGGWTIASWDRSARSASMKSSMRKAINISRWFIRSMSAAPACCGSARNGR